VQLLARIFARRVSAVLLHIRVYAVRLLARISAQRVFAAKLLVQVSVQSAQASAAQAFAVQLLLSLLVKAFARASAVHFPAQVSEQQVSAVHLPVQVFARFSKVLLIEKPSGLCFYLLLIAKRFATLRAAQRSTPLQAVQVWVVLLFVWCYGSLL